MDDKKLNEVAGKAVNNRKKILRVVVLTVMVLAVITVLFYK